MLKIKVIFIGAALLVLAGCGSNSSSSQSGSSGSTSMLAGSWSITTTEGSQVDTITTTLVPNGTTVPIGFGLPSGTVTSCSWPVGDVSAVGPACFTAANSALANLGSLSDSNPLILPLQLVVGVPQNPAPANSALSFAFAEDYDGFAYYWVFNGTGTVTNGTISGSWECNVEATISCLGMSGTLSGTQQQ
jgi:hypothetical protein